MNPNESAEITAIIPVAVGGYVLNDVAFLVYLLDNGQQVHVLQNDEMCAASESKNLELRTILMSNGEARRDLGL